LKEPFTYKLFRNNQQDATM